MDGSSSAARRAERGLTTIELLLVGIIFVLAVGFGMSAIASL